MITKKDIKTEGKLKLFFDSIRKIWIHVRKSIFARNFSPVYVSDYMSGKMEGIPSISTNCRENPFCKARSCMEGTICRFCFAQLVLSRYTDTDKNTAGNNAVLAEVLPVEYLPIFPNVQIVRFESFGDLFCVEQVINYFNICQINPRVRFALWTKNPGFVAKAIKAGYDKPENLQIIYSNLNIDKPLNIAFIKRIFPFVDKVFSVYSDDYIAEHNIDINCGARDCASCQACYTAGGTDDIRERLK